MEMAAPRAFSMQFRQKGYVFLQTDSLFRDGVVLHERFLGFNHENPAHSPPYDIDRNRPPNRPIR